MLECFKFYRFLIKDVVIMMMMIIRVFHGSSGVGSREERHFKNITPSRQFRQEFSRRMKINISLIISALFQ